MPRRNGGRGWSKSNKKKKSNKNTKKGVGDNNVTMTEEEEILEEAQCVNLIHNYRKELATSYYLRYGPATQMIESFNHFMDYSLPAILRHNGGFEHEEILDSSKNTRRIHSVKILDTKIVHYGDTQVTRTEPDGVITALYPFEARTRDLTYNKQLVVSLQYTVWNVDSVGGRKIVEQRVKDVGIGEIPIMVKSKYCSLHGMTPQELMDEKEDPDDPGGYFIIRGKEKVLIAQERPAYNQFFIFKSNTDAKYQIEMEIRSSPDPSEEVVSALWIRIPKSITSSEAVKVVQSDNNFHINPLYQQSNKIKLMGRGYIKSHKKTLERQYKKGHPGFLVYHCALRDPIPLLVLYSALGFTNDRQVWSTFGVTPGLEVKFQKVLVPTFEDEKARNNRSLREATIFIGKMVKQSSSEQYHDRQKQIRRVFTDDDHFLRGLYFVQNDVLPHIGNKAEDRNLKGYHVGYMVSQLIKAYLSLIPCDDRDHLSCKRFDMAGPLLGSLIKKLLGSYLNRMMRLLALKLDNKRKFDIFAIAQSTSITAGLIYSFSSGNWGEKTNSSTVRQGVSQILNRLNPIATQSFLRRINSPLNRLSRMIAPRKVHNSAYGYICPVDTPEGEPVGFLKNLALMAHVSVDAEIEPITKCLESLDIHPLNDGNAHLLITETKVLINATLKGTFPSEMVPLIVEKLKSVRRAWDEEKFKEFVSRRYEIRKAEAKEEERKGLAPGSSQLFQEEDLMDELEFDRMMSYQVSIAYDREHRELRIRTDAGRPLRPLFIVDENHIKIEKDQIQKLLDMEDKYGWDDWLKEEVIEFLDPAEEETALIADFPNKLLGNLKLNRFRVAGGMPYTDNMEPFVYMPFTHCEIDPCAILGISAALIPFANHNQVPRLTFQTNMSKQAVGVYNLAYNFRYDLESHVLYYGQKPLVTTGPSSDFSKFDQNPAGQEAIIAICTYGGYNQEDSIIMNQSSIDRGFQRSLYFKTKIDSEKINKGMGDQDERFEKPNSDETGMRTGMDMDNLDEDGMPFVRSEMRDGYLIIGKTRCTPKAEMEIKAASGLREFPKEDVSHVYKSLIYSTSYADIDNPKDAVNSTRTLVDNVVLCENEEGYRTSKVRLRTTRIPQMGDKFSSRHGQKGVMGIAYNEYDMPFTRQGIIPDVIINPHAIPSRMTIGHLMEMVDAKVAALSGKISVRPIFSTCKHYDDGKNGKDIMEDLAKELKARGFEGRGMELLFSGETGRKINAECFMGPCYYQRLKHMTEDKLRFRARGPLCNLTRQPNHGQMREGGLKFGEMERDSAIAHGGMSFVQERLFIVSDYYVMPTCQGCGQHMIKCLKPGPLRPIIDDNQSNYYFKCIICKSNREKGVLFAIPYAAKLLFQELMCANIKVSLFDGITEPTRSVKGFPQIGAPIPKERIISIVDMIIAEEDDPETGRGSFMRPVVLEGSNMERLNELLKIG